MRIAVLGAGVIGVTTAYYLRRAGHDVDVYDRQAGVACETSFANAGQVSWGYASPWAAPGIPLKALRWLFATHAPLVIRPQLDPGFWRWLWSMLGECRADRYRINKGRMLALARYSHECLVELRASLGLAYDNRSLGTLQLLRTDAAVRRAEADVAVLDAFNIPYERLDRTACVEVEPALARVADKLAGGLRLAGDETGDCFKFTQALADRCRADGVRFHFGHQVVGLRRERARIGCAELDSGETIGADSFVIAAGSYSAALMRSLGFSIPVYPVKGYSATLEVTCAAAAPTSTIMDEAYKVAVTRLGDRVRAAGTAELAGYDTSYDEKRCRTIVHVIKDLFPDAGDVAGVSCWAGLRPMTPDGTPIVGETPIANLFTNTGHGTLGWTMACGSGQLISDIISGDRPAISADAYAMARYDRQAGASGLSSATDWRPARGFA